MTRHEASSYFEYAYSIEKKVLMRIKIMATCNVSLNGVLALDKAAFCTANTEGHPSICIHWHYTDV